MKIYINKKRLLVALTTLCMISTSCNEDFLDRYPLDRPSSIGFFVNEVSAQNANSAIYNFWVRDSDMFQRDMMIIFDGMTDDAYWKPNRAISIQQEKWDIYPTHSAITDYWRLAYRSINAANYSIEGIPESSDPGFEELLRNQYVAEARFMRGFSYLFLVTFFGDVPLITTTLDNFDEYEHSRNSKEEVYQLILEDFEYAKANLPDNWPQSYSGRPAKAAGAAFLAKTYLFKGEYSKAEAAAREAIAIAEGTGYGLMSDYMAIFDENTEVNEEVLFAFTYVKNSEEMGENWVVQSKITNTEPDFQAIQSDGWGYALPQKSLYDAYEEDDPRRGYTVYAPGDPWRIYSKTEEKTYTHKAYDESGNEVSYTKTYNEGDTIFFQHNWSQTGMGLRKFDRDQGDLTNVRWGGKDVPVLRMAELYLFLAEALAEQGNPEALVWVNMVRARATVDLPERAVNDGRPHDENLVSIVRHERRVELAMEGKRLYDIMRWKNLGEIFNGENVKRHFYWQYLDPANSISRFDQPLIVLPKHYLFPIPQAEIDVNTLITENNPGY